MGAAGSWASQLICAEDAVKSMLQPECEFQQFHTDGTSFHPLGLRATVVGVENWDIWLEREQASK